MYYGVLAPRAPDHKREAVPARMAAVELERTLAAAAQRPGAKGPEGMVYYKVFKVRAVVVTVDWCRIQGLERCVLCFGDVLCATNRRKCSTVKSSGHMLVVPCNALFCQSMSHACGM